MEQKPIVRPGWIHVVCGCMFSGKSFTIDAIIDQERHSKIRKSLSFVPDKARRKVTLSATGEQVDTKDKLVSRSGGISEAIEFPWDSPSIIFDYITEDLTTVIIEEAHFCTLRLVQVCKILAEKHELRVVVGGLDQTFSEEGFGPIPALLVEADYVTKKRAVCTECGSLSASKSWLDTREKENVENGNVLVGDSQYKAVCRHCYKLLVEQYGVPSL